MSASHFSLEFVVYIFLLFKCPYVCSRDICHLYVLYVANIFFQSVICLLILLTFFPQNKVFKIFLYSQLTNLYILFFVS